MYHQNMRMVVFHLSRFMVKLCQYLDKNVRLDHVGLSDKGEPFDCMIIEVFSIYMLP